MIVQITEDTKSIAIRVKAWPIQRYVGDWQDIYLVIMPGQRGGHCCGHDDDCCCHQGGSPWILYGCWHFHRTGVDLMNPPRPDWPAFFIQGELLDDKKQLVFTLPERWKKDVFFGRHTGELRYQPYKPAPVNFRPVRPPKDKPQTWAFLDPGCGCAVPRPHPAAPPPPPPPHRCVLARFDIDYGPRCSQHIIDRISLELEEGALDA